MTKTTNNQIPSDQSVLIFNKIIEKAYKEVFDILQNEDLTQNRKKILDKIRKIIDETDKDIQAWIRLEIPAFYELGMFKATTEIYELSQLGDVNFNYEYAKIHKEIIESISSETYSQIASGMTGLTRTAEIMINTAIREKALRTIITGQSAGLTIKEVKKQIAKKLAEDGLIAFIDRGGKRWNLERYGEMLARTKLTQSHVSGTVNRLVGGGYDLVQVSDHSGECRLCSPWERKILSISGVNKNYPSLSQAKSGGLFHPNCRHALGAYNDDFLRDTIVWDNQNKKYVKFQELSENKKLAKIE